MAVSCHLTVVTAMMLSTLCFGQYENKQKTSPPGSTFDFSDADIDGSGCVEGPEEKQRFRLYIGRIIGEAFNLDGVERVLRAGRITHSADVNGDGKICECDLLTIFLTDSGASPGMHRHAFRVFEDGSVFDDVDLDGDGYLSDVTEKEGMTRKLAECVPVSKARNVVNAMSKLQVDDGKLAKSEYLLFLKSPHHYNPPSGPRPPPAFLRPTPPQVPSGVPGPPSPGLKPVPPFHFPQLPNMGHRPQAEKEGMTPVESGRGPQKPLFGPAKQYTSPKAPPPSPPRQLHLPPPSLQVVPAKSLVQSGPQGPLAQRPHNANTNRGGYNDNNNNNMNRMPFVQSQSDTNTREDPENGLPAVIEISPNYRLGPNLLPSPATRPGSGKQQNTIFHQDSKEKQTLKTHLEPLSQQGPKAQQVLKTEPNSKIQPLPADLETELFDKLDYQISSNRPNVNGANIAPLKDTASAKSLSLVQTNRMIQTQPTDRQPPSSPRRPKFRNKGNKNRWKPKTSPRFKNKLKSKNKGKLSNRPRHRFRGKTSKSKTNSKMMLSGYRSFRQSKNRPAQSFKKPITQRPPVKPVKQNFQRLGYQPSLKSGFRSSKPFHPAFLSNLQQSRSKSKTRKTQKSRGDKYNRQPMRVKPSIRIEAAQGGAQNQLEKELNQAANGAFRRKTELQSKMRNQKQYFKSRPKVQTPWRQSGPITITKPVAQSQRQQPYPLWKQVMDEAEIELRRFNPVENRPKLGAKTSFRTFHLEALQKKSDAKSSGETHDSQPTETKAGSTGQPTETTSASSPAAETENEDHDMSPHMDPRSNVAKNQRLPEEKTEEKNSSFPAMK